ncbi:MAG: type II toxin-antitoxin system antitoxin SocA domain-containing protein [Pseudomonadota bacterium]
MTTFFKDLGRALRRSVPLRLWEKGPHTVNNMVHIPQGQAKLPVGGEEDHAKGSERAEAPSGRDRQCCPHCPDRDRRGAGNLLQATGEAQQRLGGCEGSRGEHHIRGTSGDRAEGRSGKVGLMARAAAIANEFLSLALSDPQYGPIDQMKLQKLVYYAHAWWLGTKGVELFPEDVEAWPWGPVVRDIYYQTASFGKQPVTTRLKALDDMGNWVTPELTEGEEKAHVRAVWDVHKGFSGIELSNATHMPGEPWTIVSERHGGDVSTKPMIPGDLIRHVFRQKASS